MKITLTESLIDSLTTLSPESANQVLNACRELMKFDNDAIDLLFSDTPISTHHQCELMHRLVVFITERLTPTTQQPTPAPAATGKKSRRRRHRRSRSKRH